MKSYYSVILRDAINDEKAGTDYSCNLHDRRILDSMFEEINREFHSNYHYLAEIDLLNIQGSGSIMAKYFNEFESESVRGFIVPQLVADKINDCSQFVYQGYLHFKSSNEYISSFGEPSPAHIYVRYDNAFKKLKPKALKRELFSLVKNQRDAFYLPLTVGMLASWGIPEMEELLYSFACDDCITLDSVGIANGIDSCNPPLPFIKRELKFTAIYGLRYYPTKKCIEFLEKCINDSDEDIVLSAKKSISYIEKHTQR